MKNPGKLDFVDADCGLYKPRSKSMKKPVKQIVFGTAALAAIITVAFACCNGCGKTNSSDEQQNNQNKEFVEVNPVNDSLKVENANLQKDKKALTDSLTVLQDSLKNVSARLTDCEKGKRCPVKKVPAKKPVKKTAPVVVKPKPAPVIVKPVVDTVVAVKPAPVDTVSTKNAQVVVNNNSGNNVVNINNGTVNNYYGSAADTTKCRIIVRAKITQTIKTR